MDGRTHDGKLKRLHRQKSPSGRWANVGFLLVIKRCVPILSSIVDAGLPRQSLKWPEGQEQQGGVRS